MTKPEMSPLKAARVFDQWQVLILVRNLSKITGRRRRMRKIMLQDTIRAEFL